MTGGTKQQGWLADAASVVALPGTTGDDAPSVTALSGLLLGGEPGKLARQIIQDEPRNRTRAFAGLLDKYADPESFKLFAYFPAQVLASFPPEIDELYRWSTLVELYEAWSETISAGRFDAIDERSRQIGAAYLARTRWLLLSLPFRPGWEERISTLALERINARSGRILTLARHARDSWLEVLGAIDDYPRLKQDIDIEHDASEMAVLQITRQRLKAASPKLNLPDSPDRASDRDLAGDEVAGYVITRLLLPRFALGRVWRIVYGPAEHKARVTAWATAALGVATLAALILGLAWPATTMLRWAPLGAIAWYAIIAIVGAIRPATAWPWLMRQPASAAVGLLAIAIAPPDWWASSGKDWHVALWAALLLAAAGTGYLYFEAGSQDVRGRPRAWRPLAVAGFGYLHALMVSVIGLRFLLPEFAPRPVSGPLLSCWWQASGCGADALPSWLLVLTAASWGFAAAVFLQIIWDDQPVTAPLAHVSWRRKG